MTTFKLEQYINFSSLEELNHHVSLHVKNNQLTDSQYKLLTILSQYSVKYLGASYLKVSTLMSLLDVSRRTVQRNLKILIDLGIVKRIETLRRVRGGSGSNIYIIQEYIETANDAPPVAHSEEAQTTAGERLLEQIEQKETTSLKAKLNNSLVLHSSNKQREYNISYLDVIPSFIPRKLGEHLIKFFNSADLTRIYRACRKAVEPYEGRVDYPEDRLLDFMLQGSDALISAIKKHRHGLAAPVENIFGYVYESVLSIAVSEEFSFM